MSALIYVRDTVSNKNVPLEVDSTNQLSVNDTAANSKLSTISSTLSAGLVVNDTTSQSSLANIETSVAGILTVSDSTSQSSLSNIETSVAGVLSVSDTTAQSTLSSIDTKLAGTIVTSSGVSRTNGNIAVASAVINGDVSTAIDGNLFNKVMVFGNLGASGDITIQVSNDSTNWYEDGNSNFWSNSTVYDVAGRFDNTARYWRVKYNISGTVTLRYAMTA
tara:strand:+ start:1078 stop:1737 length:660 start_codon:yes stop_codon:yes gene_type:complete